MTDKKDGIAFCGLYCDECPAHTGKIANLARDLRKELRSARFEKTAEAISVVPIFEIFNDYQRCYEVLGAMVKLRCNRKCRNGGSNPHCEIRKCSRKKKLDGCWLCSEFESCQKLDVLKTNHGVAHINNLKRLRKNGIDGFLEGPKQWYVKPK